MGDLCVCARVGAWVRVCACAAGIKNDDIDAVLEDPKRCVWV